MHDREPVIRTIKASEARAQWSGILNAVFRRQARVIIEKSGIPVAAIISAQDLERLNRLDEQGRRDLAVLKESQAAFADIPDDELEREINNALQELRAQQRATGQRPAVS